MIEFKIAILVALMGHCCSACASALRPPRTNSVQLLKGNLEHAVTTTILTMTLSLVWGAILTIVITLAARGLGV